MNMALEFVQNKGEFKLCVREREREREREEVQRINLLKFMSLIILVNFQRALCYIHVIINWCEQ
jgi:hypothetical protein